MYYFCSFAFLWPKDSKSIVKASLLVRSGEGQLLLVTLLPFIDMVVVSQKQIIL